MITKIGMMMAVIPSENPRIHALRMLTPQQRDALVKYHKLNTEYALGDSIYKREASMALPILAGGAAGLWRSDAILDKAFKLNKKLNFGKAPRPLALGLAVGTAGALGMKKYLLREYSKDFADKLIAENKAGLKRS